MRLRRVEVCVIALLLTVLPVHAQQGESYRVLLARRVASDKLPGPQHLRDYVADGKLRLSLANAVGLMLENNTAVRMQQTQVEADKFALLRTHQPFDPQLQSIIDVNRYSYGGSNQLQGVGTSGNSTQNILSQSAQIKYNQTFQTGTIVSLGIESLKTSTNNALYFLNPNFSSTLHLQFTQPLLRNGGRFASQAPVIIARRTLQQSRTSFEAQVNDAILQVVSLYWNVVQARGALEVARRSLEAADVSYQHDKRALELGALPPLDIYRSESEVASRRVQMIQGEYAVKSAEDILRLNIGADQDPYFRALDLDLTEQTDPAGELRTLDAATALQQAEVQRPEFLAARYALENDETGIRLARNHLKPDLTLTGFYQSSGLGGDEFNPTTGELISRGGLGSSFNQLFGFSFPGYGATLTLNLPIKNRAAQADLGSALVSRHRDLYAARQIREQVMLDVSNSVHQLEQAKLTLTAGKVALDLAQKLLASAQRKYELGAEPIFFVLDAQQRLAHAETDLLQAQITYQVATAQVDHATGGLLQPYHVQIAELSQ
jgi:outer membrane protein TolC